ncbi:DMT family transporter [Billgrantia gudaonensis]|uniref:Drug/metabolite transporter, DME family n=1 Tax=Billgrantia gudaonensis TaxID=376427 RepID=A0A1G9BAL4_9GAMM|nr:DMT family transporter [Halomonas gudaonensis]SDK36110.1 drug/metabolite transporter, DME family [Halomonas gudaonensis]
MNATTRERLLGTATVLIAALLWGTTGTAATFAPEVSAVAIGAVAMGGGGLLQALLAAGRIRRHAGALCARRRVLLLGAVAVAIYPLAFYASMRLAGVTIGTVVSIGSAPLLSVLIENRLDGLRLTVRWATGAALGLGGMLLLCLAEGGGHVATGDEVVPGVLLGLLAGLSYALYSWTARRLMQRGIASRAAMGATFGIGGLLLMPVLLVTGAPLLASWGNAAVGLYMALVPMLLGYLCFGHGLARIPASTATTITLFEPVVAAGLAVAIVGERLPPLGWVGIVLILACLICVSAPVSPSRRQAVAEAARRRPISPQS